MKKRAGHTCTRPLGLVGLSALPVDGEEVLVHESLQLGFGQPATQSVFLDAAGHILSFNAALLIVVVVHLLKNFDGLLVR